MDPSTTKKEVNRPPIPKIKVKIKVKTSSFQISIGSLKGVSSVAVTFSAQGSSRHSAIITQSPQGHSRRSCRKQKTVVDPMEREKGMASFLLLSSLFFFFLTYKWVFILQSKCYLIPRKQKALLW